MTPGTTPMSGMTRYQRIRPLGRGSFGEVFEAEDALLGRRVAVKILPFAERIPVLACRALLNEARMAAAAGRAAVQVYDLVEVGGAYWLVMEYVAGGALDGQMNGDRSAAQLRAIVRSVAERLSVMHELGLVHGDIHPRNLLVRAHDDVVYSDFGLARMGRATMSKHGAHERHWSAPEVLRSGQVTPAADVYSLALVIEWLYNEAGLTPPKAARAGLADDPAARPQDGLAFARLLEIPHVSRDDVAPTNSPIELDLHAAAEAARGGRTQTAMRILESAIRQAPLDPRPRRRLALVRWMSGERQAAIWSLESAQRLDPADRLTTTMLHNWREALEGD